MDLNNLTPEEFNSLSSDELKKLTPEQILRYKESSAGLQFDKSEKPINLGKAEHFLSTQGTSNIPGGDNGWKPLPLDSLPSMGLFYPDGTTMEIRPAMVGEVRHFSTIDENDPLDVDDKLNIVIDKCLKITFPNSAASFKDLKEEDRFYLIFAIRDLTFLTGENKMYVNVKCGRTCTGDGTFQEKVELKKDHFEWYKLESAIMKFYDSNKKCFIINSPKVGTFTLNVPSIGVMTFIKNYIRDKVQRGEFYDKPFLKVAPFLFTDWRNLSETLYHKTQQDSFGWSSNKFAAVLQLVEKIRFGVKTEITRKCDKCSAEVSTPLTFSGGTRKLFIQTDGLEDLLG